MKAKYIFTIALGLALTSCSDFLNTKPAESYDPDLVWGSKANIEAFVRGRYATAYGFYRDFSGWERGYTNNMVNSLGSCPGTARGQRTTSTDVGLNGRFGYIRSCNLIIENCQGNSALTPTEQDEFVALGKLLRAMCYYDFARKTAKFIWVDKVLSEDSNFELPLTKNATESYALVLKDLREAVPNLPETTMKGEPNRNYGYALLSEVLLTAAAYTNDDPALQVNGKSLYQEAIDAVDAIKGVDLDPNYGNMFNEKGSESAEILLAQYWSAENTTLSGTAMQTLVGNIPNAQIASHACTPSWTTQDLPFEAWGDNWPSQNLVDAYLVIDEADGTAKRWDKTSQWLNNTKEISQDDAYGKFSYYTVNDSGDSAQVAGYTNASAQESYLIGYEVTNENANISDLMYKNRDARFYGSIIQDNSEFFGEYITMFYHGNYGRWSRDTYGGYNAIANYGMRKGVYTNVSPRFIYDIWTDYHEVISRYGRALLNKAEAQLRLNKVSEAVETFNRTRTIHGKLPASTASSSAQAWEEYKNERRVELFWEGDWYWSLLRWGMYGGDANYGKPSQGEIPELTEAATFIEINQERTVAFTATLGNENNMRLFPVPTYYLFPIPQSLINQNPAVTDADQNPGY